MEGIVVVLVGRAFFLVFGRVRFFLGFWDFLSNYSLWFMFMIRDILVFKDSGGFGGVSVFFIFIKERDVFF